MPRKYDVEDMKDLIALNMICKVYGMLCLFATSLSSLVGSGFLIERFFIGYK